MLKPNADDPIVVTGMGIVSPMGVGVEANWQRLIAGDSGIVRNDRFDHFGDRAGGALLQCRQNIELRCGHAKRAQFALDLTPCIYTG